MTRDFFYKIRPTSISSAADCGACASTTCDEGESCTESCTEDCLSCTTKCSSPPPFFNRRRRAKHRKINAVVPTIKRDGIYYEDKDRFSHILMIGHSCGDRCNRAYPPPRIRKRNIEGYRDCMSACESAGSLDNIFVDSGNGGGGNDENGEPVTVTEPDNGNGGNGEGMDIKTIMIWVGVILLILALILGGRFLIKKMNK